MNAITSPVLEREWEASFLPSAQTLRQWTAPGTILAVTNFADEEILLFHAIRQARRSAAKVLLVHVLQPRNALPIARRWVHRTDAGSSAESALVSLHRMARQLRWVGIPCEPLLLRGLPGKEISLVVKARGVDRILMAGTCKGRARGKAAAALVEDLLPKISIPICTVGQHLPSALAHNQRSGHITLAISLHSDVEFPLAFASRLAQDHQAKLTVLHVFGGEEKSRKEIERTPLAFASQLPAERLREAEMLCPLEIAAPKGDPATEILKFGSCTNQDFIVLGPIGQPHSAQPAGSIIVHRVISEARCPVIVLGPSVGGAAHG